MIFCITYLTSYSISDCDNYLRLHLTRIRPGARAETLSIDADGQIGVGCAGALPEGRSASNAGATGTG
jgi:hypothetical protein